jgi:hypothetical protein
LLTFPIAKTPKRATEPALLSPLIFSIFVDLQFGHFICVDIGFPQKGQASADVEISLPQSGQIINPIIFTPTILLSYF